MGKAKNEDVSRGRVVSVKFDPDELKVLEDFTEAKRISKSTALRVAFFEMLRRTAPEFLPEAWRSKENVR